MEAAKIVETKTFEKNGIKVTVEYTEGYQKRFTKAVLDAYRRTLNGEDRRLGRESRRQDSAGSRKDAV